MPLPKQEKKENFFLVIVAIALPKMEKKIEWNYDNVIAENGRKKKYLLPKSGKKFLKKCYFHNIFIILSHQIIGDQLLLVQI